MPFVTTMIKLLLKKKVVDLLCSCFKFSNTHFNQISLHVVEVVKIYYVSIVNNAIIVYFLNTMKYYLITNLKNIKKYFYKHEWNLSILYPNKPKLSNEVYKILKLCVPLTYLYILFREMCFTWIFHKL
jgi:hypothetical protein